MGHRNNRTTGKKYVRVGTGYSEVERSFDAGQDAANKSIVAMERRYTLEEVTPEDLTLTMVFSSKHYEVEQMQDELKELLDGVRAVTANCPLVGCTTAGTITDEGVQNNAVSVMTLSSEVIRAGTGVGMDLIKDAAGAGENAVTEALEKMRSSSDPPLNQEVLRSYFTDPASAIRFNPFTVIMFPQGRVLSATSVYDEELIRGMRRKVGNHVPIIGGSSANGSRMKASFQFCDGDVYRNSVVCAVLFSLVNRGFSVSHPFVPMPIIKRPRAKLKEQYPPLFPGGNRRGYTILELDDVPAAKNYFELVKDKIPEKNYDTWLEKYRDKPIHLLKDGKLLYYPFGLSDSEGNFWMTKISSIKMDGSIELTSLIPDESVLTIMELRAGKTAEDLVCVTAKEAVEGAKRNATVTNPDEIAAVFVFDCNARYYMVGDPRRELEAIRNAADDNTPIIGFYGYGEQLSSLQFPLERIENTCTVMVLSQKLSGEA